MSGVGGVGGSGGVPPPLPGSGGPTGSGGLTGSSSGVVSTSPVEIFDALFSDDSSHIINISPARISIKDFIKAIDDLIAALKQQIIQNTQDDILRYRSGRIAKAADALIAGASGEFFAKITRWEKDLETVNGHVNTLNQSISVFVNDATVLTAQDAVAVANLQNAVNTWNNTIFTNRTDAQLVQLTADINAWNALASQRNATLDVYESTVNSAISVYNSHVGFDNILISQINVEIIGLGLNPAPPLIVGISSITGTANVTYPIITVPANKNISVNASTAIQLVINNSINNVANFSKANVEGIPYSSIQIFIVPVFEQNRIYLRGLLNLSLAQNEALQQLVEFFGEKFLSPNNYIVKSTNPYLAGAGAPGVNVGLTVSVQNASNPNLLGMLSNSITRAIRNQFNIDILSNKFKLLEDKIENLFTLTSLSSVLTAAQILGDHLATASPEEVEAALSAALLKEVNGLLNSSTIEDIIKSFFNNAGLTDAEKSNLTASLAASVGLSFAQFALAKFGDATNTTKGLARLFPDLFSAQPAVASPKAAYSTTEAMRNFDAKAYAAAVTRIDASATKEQLQKIFEAAQGDKEIRTEADFHDYVVNELAKQGVRLSDAEYYANQAIRYAKDGTIGPITGISASRLYSLEEMVRKELGVAGEQAIKDTLEQGPFISTEAFLSALQKNLPAGVSAQALYETSVDYAKPRPDAGRSAPAKKISREQREEIFRKPKATIKATKDEGWRWSVGPDGVRWTNTLDAASGKEELNKKIEADTNRTLFGNTSPEQIRRSELIDPTSLVAQILDQIKQLQKLKEQLLSGTKIIDEAETKKSIAEASSVLENSYRPAQAFIGSLAAGASSGKRSVDFLGGV